MNYIGIIPARYGSSRFPGKPLAILGGKPVIQWVYEQARKALEVVYVATDDERIADCVHGFGGKVVMTCEACRCGTERCAEAYKMLRSELDGLDEDTDVIINIQGDEPFVQPEQIEALKDCFPTDIATLVVPYHPSDGIEALQNPNQVKAVVSDGRAVLFSRSVVPYLRGVEMADWLTEAEHRGKPYYRHLGMYAYRANVLEIITTLPPSPLEQAESLEQLRWLEAGYTIRVGLTDRQTIGIDTPEDLIAAEAALNASKACY